MWAALGSGLEANLGCSQQLQITRLSGDRVRGAWSADPTSPHICTGEVNQHKGEFSGWGNPVGRRI